MINTVAPATSIHCIQHKKSRKEKTTLYLNVDDLERLFKEVYPFELAAYMIHNVRLCAEKELNRV